ncbi:MAG TPA: prepilin-type N-terminal cleavage/methylation domain-containing protein [Kofleriaceae bacterium]|jgi:general secretion pathway protein H
MKLGARRGITILEMMIVLAIIALAALLARTGFRTLTKADLVDNSTELAAIMKRAQQLAIEHGELYRVTMDLDKQVYVVEVCEGQVAIQRNEAVRTDAEAKKHALETAKARMNGMPPEANAPSQSTDPEDANRRALAIVGHHIADRTCAPATDSWVGVNTDAGTKGKPKGWARGLRAEKGIKFKEVWVQHRDGSVAKGQVAVYFWPNGSSEKAVVELTDGDEVFSVLVYGLTGRIELKDGVLRDVDDHMMRNAMGDKDAKREGEL